MAQNRKVISDLFKEVEPGKTIVMPSDSRFAERLKQQAPQAYLYFVNKVGQYASGELGAQKAAQDTEQILPPLSRTTDTNFEMAGQYLESKLSFC